MSILATGYCEFFLLLYAFAPTIAPPNEASLSYLESHDGTHLKAHTTIIVTCVMWLVQYFCLNLLLLGSDEVASQLEHPFRMLPVDALIAKTERAMKLAPTIVMSLLDARNAPDGDSARLGVPPGISLKRSSWPLSPTFSEQISSALQSEEGGARLASSIAKQESGSESKPLRSGPAS